MTSDSLMPPVAAWMTLTATCSCGSFAISSWSASSEPETSALRTMLSSLSSPSVARAKTSSRRDPARLAASELLGLQAVAALLGELARLAVVLDHLDALAGLADAVEAEDLDGIAGRGLLDAARRCRRASPAPCPSAGRRRPRRRRASVPRWTSTRRDRPAAGVELRLDHRAGRGRVGVGLQLLELGDEQDHLEQVVEALLGLRGDVDEDRVAAPVLGVEALLAQARCGRGPGWRPRLSILLTATRIGTSAARAWSIASTVCGMTPSSAATTMTAMSVTLAPRARIAVNASWPGVSRKVIVLPLWRTW